MTGCWLMPGWRGQMGRVCGSEAAHPSRPQQCRARGGLQGADVEQQRQSRDSKEWPPARIPGGDMKNSCEVLWPEQTSGQCIWCLVSQ